jgi:uncharacterized protein (TIGR03067 family)
MRLAISLEIAFAFAAVLGCTKSAPQNSSADLEGLWGFISSEVPGYAAPSEVMQNLSWYFHGNEITITQGCESLPGKVTFQIDRRHAPIIFDFTVHGDDYPERTSLGICALDDGQLRICSADPGCPRPSEFRVAKNTSLMVLKKIEQ